VSAKQKIKMRFWDQNKVICKGAQEKLLGLVAKPERTRAALPVSRAACECQLVFFARARRLCGTQVFTD